MHTTLSAQELLSAQSRLVQPGEFHPSTHFYPRVLNAQMHPLVASFFRMRPEQLVSRYCHLNPQVDREALLELLTRQTKHLHWAGADLFYTVTEEGARRMIVVETNSCPSGHKSTPLLSEDHEHGGFQRLIEHSFLPRLKRREKKSLPQGGLAVIYDKNYMEASGYATTLADLTHEPVYLAPMPHEGHVTEDGARAAWFNSDGVLIVRGPNGEEVPIRAAMRYVTQRPWTRVPCGSKTLLTNPVVACLAGGRNKLIASKAYELFNGKLSHTGLQIRTPKTIHDVTLQEVPLWVERFGGYAVVKNPYSNAGQGVWTITSERDLELFKADNHSYDQFIVQALIGDSGWSSRHAGSRYFHVGTMPNRRGEIFVADLRMMVCSGPDGFKPVSIYARRASTPLPPELHPDTPSWPILGTNLSVDQGAGSWAAETERLLLMDERDFNKLGLGPDDLVEGYIQAVLSTLAIDEMASRLSYGSPRQSNRADQSQQERATRKGDLKVKLFSSLNNDPALLLEIKQGSR